MNEQPTLSMGVRILLVFVFAAVGFAIQVAATLMAVSALSSAPTLATRILLLIALFMLPAAATIVSWRGFVRHSDVVAVIFMGLAIGSAGLFLTCDAPFGLMALSNS